MTNFIRSNSFNHSCILKVFHIRSNPTARYANSFSYLRKGRIRIILNFIDNLLCNFWYTL